MNERQAFLDAIKADPLDYVTRQVFADWLEEHDEPEMADWQRAQRPERIIEAKEWILELCGRHVTGYDHDGPILYEDLIASVDRGHYTQRGSTSLQHEENEKEFLRRWAIVTDTPMSDEDIKAKDYSFACSC